jgi:hypothetical protein
MSEDNENPNVVHELEVVIGQFKFVPHSWFAMNLRLSADRPEQRTFLNNNATEGVSQSEVPSHEQPAERRNTSLWLPTSLSRVYLICVALWSFALAIACIAVEAKSDEHNGFTTARSSESFGFTWRYMPTLVAVVYSLFWTPIMTDVLRTEPWALMALPDGANASETLLKIPGPWYLEVVDTYWRRRGRSGGVRWAAFLAISATMLVSLVINPLSSSLLAVTDVEFTSSGNFTTWATPKATPEFVGIGDVTLMEAIANTVYNVSSSAWSLPQYAVKPFWVTGTSPLVRASLSNSVQTWNVSTDVFKIQVQCERSSYTNYSSSGLTGDLDTSAPFYAEFPSGCNESFAPGFFADLVELTISGGALWISSSCASTDLIMTFQYVIAMCLLIIADACDRTLKKSDDSGLFFVSSVSLFACSSNYTTSNQVVSVFASTANSTAKVNDELFKTKSTLMDSTYLNTSLFESEFLSDGGSDLNFNLANIAPATAESFAGPAGALAAHYKMDIALMAASDAPNLSLAAQLVKQEFLNTVLLSTFTNLGANGDVSKLTGLTTSTAARLLVVPGFSYGLGAILVVLGFAAAALTILTNLKRRPLQLHRDPATAAAAALIVENSEIPFNGLDHASEIMLRHQLEGEVFKMRDGKLHHSGKSEPRFPLAELVLSRIQGLQRRNHRPLDHSWTPWKLSLPATLMFLFVLIATINGLLVIRYLAIGPGLYQAAFTYTAQLTFRGSKIAAVAPYSIFPTLLASLIKVYWYDFDNLQRINAPFFMMAQAPQVPSNGATLNYINTPIGWISGIALKNRHWFLSVITIGTLALEVLQIVMSALWTVQFGVITKSADLNQTLEVRSIPHIFQYNDPTATGAGAQAVNPGWEYLPHFYGSGQNVYQSWLFRALAQSAFDETPPPWSKDGWGFPPVDFSIATNIPVARLGLSQDVSSLGPALNLTYNTVGLSATLNCTIETDSTANFTRPYWFRNSNGQPVPGNVSLGFWSDGSSETSFDSSFSPTWLYSDNITWTGNAGILNNPQILTLSCQPIYHKANATVTVDASNGNVLDSTIIDTPMIAAEAWTHGYDFTDFHYYNLTDWIGMNANSSVSWGWILSEAINGASADLGTDAQTSLQFNETDMIVDIFSYATLANTGFNSSALLDVDTFIQSLQTTFSTFFQAFISLPNQYDDYWAWQTVNATLPNLDQAPLVTLTSTKTESITVPIRTCHDSTCLPVTTSMGTLTETKTIVTVTGFEVLTVRPAITTSLIGSFSTSYFPGGTSSFTLDEIYDSTTISALLTTFNGPSVGTSTPLAAQTNSIATSSTTPDTTTPVFLHRRDSFSSSTSPPLPFATAIRATMHVRAQVLHVSTGAVAAAVSILGFLIILTAASWYKQRDYSRRLPRSVETPASLMAFVYASKKLQQWSKYKEGLGELDGEHHGGARMGVTRTASDLLAYRKESEFSLKREKSFLRREDMDHVKVAMGEFGNGHWGVEVSAIPQGERSAGSNGTQSYGQVAESSV